MYSDLDIDQIISWKGRRWKDLSAMKTKTMKMCV